MGRAGSNGAGATGVIPSQRTAVRMWLRGFRRVPEDYRRVPEDVLDELEPGAQAFA
jgi:hypothetical protein